MPSGFLSSPLLSPLPMWGEEWGRRDAGGGTRKAPSPPQCCYCRKSPPHTHSQPLCLLSVLLPSSLLSQLGRGLKAWPFFPPPISPSSPPPPELGEAQGGWATRPFPCQLLLLSSLLLFLSFPFSSSSRSFACQPLQFLCDGCGRAPGSRAARGRAARRRQQQQQQPGIQRGRCLLLSGSVSIISLLLASLHSCHIGRPPGSRRMLARPHRNFLLLENPNPGLLFLPQNPLFSPFFLPISTPSLRKPPRGAGIWG